MAKYHHEKKRSGCAKVFLALLLLAIVGALLFYWSNNTLGVSEYVCSSERLPPEFDGFRIVQLSDVHGKEFGQGNEYLLKKVAGAEPDLIAITGDLIDRWSQTEMLPALAAGLAAIAPTYYVTGNHEWAVGNVPELKALLEDCGVRVLSNEFELWTEGEHTLAVAGADDPNGLAGQKTGEELRAEIDADYTVLLAHRDTVESYETWGYDLVLCGHGHGGIFRIPLIDQGLLSTSRTFFPEYDGGIYAYDGGGACVVSRGLGSNTVPIHAFRLFNQPELVAVTLKTA